MSVALAIREGMPNINKPGVKMSKKSLLVSSVSVPNKKNVAERFANERKFIEHNIELQQEAQSKPIITEIQDFLDSYYDKDNNEYIICTSEPKVIAKVVLYFKTNGWNVKLSKKEDKINLIFSVKE